MGHQCVGFFGHHLGSWRFTWSHPANIAGAWDTSTRDSAEATLLSSSNSAPPLSLRIRTPSYLVNLLLTTGSPIKSTKEEQGGHATSDQNLGEGHSWKVPHTRQHWNVCKALRVPCMRQSCNLCQDSTCCILAPTPKLAVGHRYLALVPQCHRFDRRNQAMLLGSCVQHSGA